MELIYAYIGKYRTFENQKISFSNKFNVSYDDKEKTLSITRNSEYFDVYPGNIVGVSAILGKNASGKTSLIDLIGKKIRFRKEDLEIIKPHKLNSSYLNDPHRKKDIFHRQSTSTLEPVDFYQKDVYQNYYFFIYYYGKNDKNQDIYIFESDAPYLFIDMFTGYKDRLNSLDYYADKSWISFVFLSEGSYNYILGDTQNYKIKGETITRDISVIRFFKRDYFNIFDREHSNQEENTIISVWRRYSSIKNLYLYNQLAFLIKSMKEKSETLKMYSDEYYTVNISFRESDTSLEELESKSHDESDVIPDYREFISNQMSYEEKTVLAILWQYTWFIFRAIMRPQEKLIQNDPRVDLLEKLYKNEELPSVNDYAGVKDFYHQKIRLLLDNDPDREYRYAESSNIEHAEEALENFLSNANFCKIEYRYSENLLSFTIKKDTELNHPDHSVKSFFDDFLDEPIKKNMEQEDSLLGGFFKSDIQFLSDGEKENLAMFASIDEQVRINLENKRKYILLFDEIERSMHPELCRNLVLDLMEFLHKYPEKEFQIIIASHSPFIASDIPKGNVVQLTRERERSIVVKPDQSSFGQNIHTILKTQFFLNSTFGAYAEVAIGNLEKWLTSDLTKDTVREQINKFLEGVSNGYNYEKTYLISTEDTIRFLQAAIDNIGESVLNNYFQQLLNRQKKSLISRNKLIQYYEKQLKILKGQEQSEDNLHD